MEELLLSKEQLQAMAHLVQTTPLGICWVERTNLESQSAVDPPTVAVALPGDEDDVKYLIDRSGSTIKMDPTEGMRTVDPADMAASS